MSRASPAPASPETSELILEAAGRIFARKGFRSTTVRQITQAAGVNVAAVNYHFHDKKELYTRVLKRAHQAADRTAAADLADHPQKRLRAFIHGFVEYLFDPRRPDWQGRLLAREIAEPSPALDRLAAESVRPVKEQLCAIVRELLGPGSTDLQVQRSALSVIGQCLHYVHCREMIKRLFPNQPEKARDAGALADHIFHFSLAGITALRRQIKAETKRHRYFSKHSRPSIS